MDVQVCPSTCIYACVQLYIRGNSFAVWVTAPMNKNSIKKKTHTLVCVKKKWGLVMTFNITEELKVCTIKIFIAFIIYSYIYSDPAQIFMK
jgi:hypothetical protein